MALVFVHEEPAAFHGCRLFFLPIGRPPSRGGTTSQRPFGPRPVAGRHLNSHLGLVPRRDGISTAILASSRGGTASQQPFGPRPAAGRHLNSHLGLVSWRDGISTAILAPSRGGTASQRPFGPRPVAGRGVRLPHRNSCGPGALFTLHDPTESRTTRGFDVCTPTESRTTRGWDLRR